MFDGTKYEATHRDIWKGYLEKYKSDYLLPLKTRTSCMAKDGVINPIQYKRILFFLKEAYCSNSCASCENSQCDAFYDGVWDLRAYIAKDWPKSSIMRNRVAEWTHGILNTTKETICSYSAWSDSEMQAALNSIAIVNVKKINGKKDSKSDDLERYVNENAIILRQEIEAAQPKVIVCGYTYKYLKRIFSIKERKCDNWYYYAELPGFLEKVLILDYYHPAAQYPNLLMYYGITNIYQQALLSGDQSC